MGTYLDTKIPNVLYCMGCYPKFNLNDIAVTDGYTICTLCGTVLGTRVSEYIEWSDYTVSSRCGAITKTTEINPFSNHLISFIPKTVNNVCFKDGKQVKYSISNVHIKNSANYKQKSFSTVEQQLEAVAGNKYSGRIINTSKLLWAEIAKGNKTTRAGVRKGLIACCLYYSCMYYDCPRSPLEICQDFGMEDTKQFNKGNKEFKEIFEYIPRWAELLTKTSNSEDYFNRFCCALERDHVIKEGTSFNLAKECRELHECMNTNDITGICPKNLACGIIVYIMKKRGMPLVKSKISKVLGICSTSLTKANLIVEEIVEK